MLRKPNKLWGKLLHATGWDKIHHLLERTNRIGHELNELSAETHAMSLTIDKNQDALAQLARDMRRGSLPPKRRIRREARPIQ